MEQILSRCVAQIIRSDGLIPVQELAEESGYSVRYLRQLFVQHVGHSPKELAMIVRMQRALRWIWEHPGDSLGETAARFGFADQSHMNREFRRFLGVTSGAVQGIQSGSPGFGRISTGIFEERRRLPICSIGGGAFALYWGQDHKKSERRAFHHERSQPFLYL